MGINNKINWKISKFIALPDKLKPSPLNLMFKDLRDLDISLDKNKIKFQAIDFDQY